MTKNEKYALYILMRNGEVENTDRRVQKSLDKLLDKGVLIETVDGLEIAGNYKVFLIPGDGLPLYTRKAIDVVVVDMPDDTLCDAFCIEDLQPASNALIEAYVDGEWVRCLYKSYAHDLFGTGQRGKKEIAFTCWRHADYDKHTEAFNESLFPSDAVEVSIRSWAALFNAIGAHREAVTSQQALLRTLSDCFAPDPFLSFERMFAGFKGNYAAVKRFAAHCKRHGFDVDEHFFKLRPHLIAMSEAQINAIDFSQYDEHTKAKERNKAALGAFL